MEEKEMVMTCIKVKVMNGGGWTERNGKQTEERKE